MRIQHIRHLMLLYPIHSVSLPLDQSHHDHHCMEQVFNRNAFSVGGWCKLCAMVLTEDDVTPEDVK